MRKMRSTYNILIGKYEKKKRFVRSKYNLESSIKVELRDTGYEIVD